MLSLDVCIFGSFAPLPLCQVFSPRSFAGLRRKVVRVGCDGYWSASPKMADWEQEKVSVKVLLLVKPCWQLLGLDKCQCYNACWRLGCHCLKSKDISPVEGNSLTLRVCVRAGFGGCENIWWDIWPANEGLYLLLNRPHVQTGFCHFHLALHELISHGLTWY